MNEEKYHYHWTTTAMGIILWPVAILYHIVFMPSMLLSGLMSAVFPDRHQEE